MNKNNFFLKIILLLSTLLIISCAYSIHEVHMSDFTPFNTTTSKKTFIRAKAEQFVVLGWVFDTNYVNQAYNQLQDQCKNGLIKGISTQFSTALGFFSWTNKILMQGTCIN